MSIQVTIKVQQANHNATEAMEFASRAAGLVRAAKVLGPALAAGFNTQPTLDEADELLSSAENRLRDALGRIAEARRTLNKN